MGSKISVLDETSLRQSCEVMIGAKRHNSSSKKSLFFHCCKNHDSSSNFDLTPEYGVNTKRSKKCLNLNIDDSKEIVQTSIQKGKKKMTRATQKRTTKERRMSEKESYLAAFFKIFDDDVIQDFLWMDSCYRLSDKYLLSMVYTYFRRANLSRPEYNRTNFFAALYLSHDMEEDNEDLKLEIFPWVLGRQWRIKHYDFINQRDSLLKRMGYRAAVSKQTCDEVMDLCAYHPIWKRERKAHHGGAERTYDEDNDFYPRGPDGSPIHCKLCEDASNEISTSSPTYTSGYLSACSIDFRSTVSFQGSKSDIVVVDDDSDQSLCREE